jgi:hypothetical protein
VGRGFCPAAELPLGVYRGNENPRITRKGRSSSPGHAGQKPGSRAEALPHDAASILKVHMQSDTDKRQLEEQGYIVMPCFLSEAEVEKFRTRVEELFAEEGNQSGSEFKQEPGARRLANAVDKGEIFEKVIETPEVLECVEAVLGPDFKLSSLNVRSANPHR